MLREHEVEELTSSQAIVGKATKNRIMRWNALMLFITAVIFAMICVQYRLPDSARILMSSWSNGAKLDDQALRSASTSPGPVSTSSTFSPGTSTFKSIPMIFHQTYGSEMVRNEYKPFVHGCLILNPEWKYYLWRDSDIEAFVQDHYPWLLNKYKGLRLKVERGDIIRYMALHYYGGIYLDMDIQCAKPFFPTLKSKGPLFFDQERKEQAYMLYGHKATVMNSAIGSVPNHPFFLKLLLAINATPSNAEAPLWTTGPHILTAVYNNWTAGPEQARNPVLLLEPEVFSPIMDGGPWYYLPRFCRGVDSKPASQLTERENWIKKGCDMTRSKSWKQDISSANVTVGRHMFKHLGWYSEGSNIWRFNIRLLHPAVKMYKEHRMPPGI